MQKRTSAALLWAIFFSVISVSGAAAQQQAEPPTDAEIAAIVVAANNVDIMSGKAAGKKTKNQQVKDFANQMVTDHSTVNKDATALVDKLKVKPQESDTSRSLMSNGKTKLADMKKLKGAAFDKAYMQNEVEFHQTVIDTIDNTLIPNAKNPELKALLTTYRPVFQSHLEHAQRLTNEMNQPKRSMQGT